MKLFHYINYGLAIILSFVGVKLLIHQWYVIDHQFALLFVVSTLGFSVLASWLFPKKNHENFEKKPPGLVGVSSHWIITTASTVR